MCSLERVKRMNKQLFRSRTNKKIAGVCGGIAEYFNIDPTIVRLIWLLFSFTYGIGFLAYLVAVIVIPEARTDNSEYHQGPNHGESQQAWNSEAHKENSRHDNSKAMLILGIALVVVGGILLINLYIPWINWHYLWPLIIIGIGVLVILRGGGSRR